MAGLGWAAAGLGWAFFAHVLGKFETIEDAVQFEAKLHTISSYPVLEGLGFRGFGFRGLGVWGFRVLGFSV